MNRVLKPKTSSPEFSGLTTKNLARHTGVDAANHYRSRFAQSEGAPLIGQPSTTVAPISDPVAKQKATSRRIALQNATARVSFLEKEHKGLKDQYTSFSATDNQEATMTRCSKWFRDAAAFNEANSQEVAPVSAGALSTDAVGNNSTGDIWREVQREWDLGSKPSSIVITLRLSGDGKEFYEVRGNNKGLVT